MTKKALVLIHEANEGPALFGDILNDLNFDIRNLYSAQTDLSTINALEPDFLLVMGGPMGVYEANQYPFLKEEMRILRERMAKDLPTMGICLGSQLMAGALGKNVYKGKQGKEIGWSPLEMSEYAKNHPVRHLSPTKTNMFHWHGDTFDLPDGAKLLASSSKYNHQIYEVGKRALALQCHPEVKGKELHRWFEGHVDDMTADNTKEEIKELDRQTYKHSEKLSEQAELFFREWLAHVGL